MDRSSNSSQIGEKMLDVTSENFEQEVLNSEKPVVIDFWAEWCGPCRMMSPVFKDLSEEMPDVKFVKIDVDSNNELAQKYDVKSIPSFLVMRAGAVAKTIIGAQSKMNIKSLIENAIV